MSARYLRSLIVLPIAATSLCVCQNAAADDKNPVAIEQRLKSLESDSKQKLLVASPAERARKALRRVVDAQVAGDAAHAVELTALADELVTLAANIVRAVAVEKELATLQEQLTEIEQKRRRTETLLEATVAQRERTREELKHWEAEKAKPERGSAKKAESAKPSPATPAGSGALVPTAASTKTTSANGAPAAAATTNTVTPHASTTAGTDAKSTAPAAKKTESQGTKP